MNKNVQLVLLVVVAGVLAFVTIRQRTEIAELKSTIEHAKLPESAPAGQSTPPPPQSIPKSPPPAPQAVIQATTPAPAPAPTGAAGTTNFFAGLAGMMKDPAMKDMIRMQQKMALDRMYGSLSKYLNLPAEKLDSLKEILADRQMALTEAGMSMMSGSESDRKNAVEDSKTVKTDYDQKIQDLLGAQDYEVFKQYEQTAPDRMQLQMFKDALPADAALTDQQEDDLIGAMYEERKALPPSSLVNNQNPDPSQLTEERIAETLKQLEDLRQRYAGRAATILTPSQLEQFTKWQQQWSAMQAMGMKMAAQMFGNKSVQQPPPQ